MSRRPSPKPAASRLGVPVNDLGARGHGLIVTGLELNTEFLPQTGTSTSISSTVHVGDSSVCMCSQ